MPDFWRNSGFHLLERSSDGRLSVTDDFLRAYLMRPEIRPVEESGPNEVELHEALLEDPRRDVEAEALERIEDADARDNYRLLLAFFERLKRAACLESCYLEIFSGGNVSVPPLFVDQLAQIIVRGVLEGCDDPLEPRAGELFFREQKAGTDDGVVMLADLETVEMRASGGSLGNLGRLIVEAQAPLATVNLDVLDTENAQNYWVRDQRHDFVISMNFGRAANKAFCRVVEKWIRHFFGVAVSVAPLRSIEDRNWAWHIGLDAESTALLNELWRGEEVEPGRFRRMLALFRLDFDDPASMRSDIAGRPVYLALSMDDNNAVRMKPQNLLLNLPLASRA
ncbi:MAG: hypothetical protein E6H75_05700 [Betaproteobacteria bacterium]|nr:MAG: hypothetical protein E6H75_05700 [Betaproteobacteria bacterium]